MRYDANSVRFAPGLLTMIDLANIGPLTDFKRHTPEHIAELKRTGKPAVLTVNGRAEVVVQDAAAYQQLLDALDRAEAAAGVRAGLADVAAGRVGSVAQAMDLVREAMGPRLP